MFAAAAAVFPCLAEVAPPAGGAPGTADSAAVAAGAAQAAQTAGAPGTVAWVLAGLLAAGLLPACWFYGRAAWRTLTGHGRVEAANFGPAEAGVATALTTLLLAIIVGGFALAARDTGQEPKLLEGHAIVRGVLLDTAVKAALVVALCVGLSLRGLNPGALLGLHRLGFGGVLLAGAGLLLAAMPIVYATSFAAEWLTGGADRHGPEEAIRLLLAARDPASRLAMVGAAVVVAPVFEEFLFRGYLYGVMRRYLGVAGGIVLNSALFAGIHLHVPSLAPLFLFAVCLSLAYERTGSLLVPMTMHALFNALSVSLLILGGGEK